MTTLLQEPNALLTQLQHAVPADLNECLRQTISWSKSASEEGLNALLVGIAEHIDAQRGHSNLCALLLQYVTLPQEGASSIIERMLEVVSSSAPESLEFLNALSQMSLPEGTDPDSMEPDDLDALLLAQRQRLAQDHPQSAAHAKRIKDALSAALGILERERQTLRAARASSAWRDILQDLSSVLEEARMMRALFEGFDAQQVLCVALDTGDLWTLRVDGVTDLKQLHALLIHALIKPLDEEALSVVNGSGPHFNGSWVEGQWTFWDSPEASEPLSEEDALTRLPRVVWKDTSFVVVCVRKAQAYASWTLMRTFDMPATIEVVEHSNDEAQIDAILASLNPAP